MNEIKVLLIVTLGLVFVVVMFSNIMTHLAETSRIRYLIDKVLKDKK